MGTAKSQIALLVNLVVVVLCAGVAALSAFGLVPENRMKLVIFSQVLAMLVSALLGSNLMLDSLGGSAARPVYRGHPDDIDLCRLLGGQRILPAGAADSLLRRLQSGNDHGDVGPLAAAQFGNGPDGYHA